ncbi:MAG TPA: DUF2127 domain-containing protein [Candidatus Saccharimonadales bacterium]|nr:DUF2127 domain-containing protein [Candidatus Saccharimonadales bacterium]
MFKRLTTRQDSAVDLLFVLSILGKGIGGALQLIAGLLLIFINISTLHNWLQPLNLDVDVARGIAESEKWFGVAYLFTHGIIRVGLAIALLREKLWAYPAAIVALGGFIAYQSWLMLSHPSVYLLALTLFDLLIVGLTVYEYLKLRQGGHLNLPTVK